MELLSGACDVSNEHAPLGSNRLAFREHGGGGSVYTHTPDPSQESNPPLISHSNSRAADLVNPNRTGPAALADVVSISAHAGLVHTGQA